MIRTGSASKKVVFEKEQREILDKILSIIGLDKENNTFTLYQLSKTPEKIEQIIALKPDIAKFFSASSWNCFKNDEIKSDTEHMVILRNILKTFNIKYTSESYRFTLEKNTHISTQKYTIHL
jgi:uncharacterized membrane-anchored protein